VLTECQICATGLDDDYKKPKGLADQVIRVLDEDDVTPEDRLRLLVLYLLFRDGLLPADLQKLLAHAQLPAQHSQIISNFELVGARTSRNLKDSRPPPQPLFPPKPQPVQTPGAEEVLLSRYEPALQSLLEAHADGKVDHNAFPYTKPPLDLGQEQAQVSATSLRAARPTWAKTKSNVSAENRQRVIIFMAGGATYSESRACYNVGRATGREVFLATSHMLTPQLFIRQVGDLSVDKRRLGIPAEQPKPTAPQHLFEPDEQPKPAQPAQQVQQRPGGPRPPEQEMANMNLNGRPNGGGPQQGAFQNLPNQTQTVANSSAKLSKDKDKKRHHFGFGKKS
jgi:syntaxin-binding protein 1